MAKYRHLILISGLLVIHAAGPVVTMAQHAETTITLVNGALVKGELLACSEAGIEIMVAGNIRKFPWYSLAPGSRYKYDVRYRMNAFGFLTGKPLNALTNAPDPTYNPMNPATWVVENAAVATVPGQGINFAAFTPGPSIKPAEWPALIPVVANPVSYWAMQYGPAEREMTLFGFPGNDITKLYLVNKGDSRFITETATTRTIGGTEYLSFPKKTYKSQFDDVTAAMHVQWLIASSDATRRVLQADVSLSRNTQQAAFVLQGTPPGIKAGTNTVTPRFLLVEPALAFTIQIEDDIPYLVGQVRMSRLNLLPRSGMDLKVMVTIADAKGKVEMKRDVPFKTDVPPGEYPLRIDLSSLTAGQSYQVSATIFLGAFFGKLTYEELFILPDALKL